MKKIFLLLVAAAWISGCTGQQYGEVNQDRQEQAEPSERPLVLETEPIRIEVLPEEGAGHAPAEEATAADPADSSGAVDPAGAADPSGAVDPAGAADPSGAVDLAGAADPAGTANPAGTALARILVGGDILLSQHVLNAYEQAGGIHGVLDGPYRKAIEQADVFLANEEFPFSNRGTAAADKQYTFRLPPERVSVFQELGLDIVSLANNHALDYGREALTDTVAALDAAGIAHIGAGERLEAAKAPAIREIGGLRVGFIGATRVIPVADWAATGQSSGMLATYDPAVLLEGIRDLRRQCDFLIVFVHWGIERDTMPQDYQRQLGRQYLDAGADLVVGSHPHVLQGIEYYQGKPIVYSLGNFIFGSSIPRTMLLQVDVQKEGGGYVPQLSLIPGTSAAGHTRTLADEAALNQFYQTMENCSYGVSFAGAGAIRTAVPPVSE